MIPTNLELAPAESFSWVGARGMEKHRKDGGSEEGNRRRGKKVQGEKKDDVVLELYLAVMWVLLSAV